MCGFIAYYNILKHRSNKYNKVLITIIELQEIMKK